MHIDFPQYAAEIETVGEPPNVTVIVRCPLCGKEILRRTWMGFEKPSEPEIDESHPLVQSRLADSAKDREVYWTHLETAHSEEIR